MFSPMLEFSLRGGYLLHADFITTLVVSAKTAFFLISWPLLLSIFINFLGPTSVLQ